MKNLCLAILTILLAGAATVAAQAANGAPAAAAAPAASADPAAAKANAPAGNAAKAAAVTSNVPADLAAKAKISLEAARATALAKVPKGKLKSEELEEENGKLLYSFDIKVPGKSGVEEVEVDALDGSVLKVGHESAKAEKAEAAKDAKAAKAAKAKARKPPQA
ncbi:MAG TPA: PepSY domain-containing protein [Thermoanaerobaculia bacterium]|nr:PepSY domain-containing protein [Thermoanaerobaculia bacterium]